MDVTSITTLYSTLAMAAATLIGLLFVAVSLVLGRKTSEQEKTGVSIQASGCLFCFIDVLAVTLFGIAEPKGSIGSAVLIIGLIGLLYALASLRSIQQIKSSWQNVTQNLGFLAMFILLFAIQSFTGIKILTDHLSSTKAFNDFKILPIIILIVGVLRTWQLIGLRDTGALSSLITIVHKDRPSSR